MTRTVAVSEMMDQLVLFRNVQDQLTVRSRLNCSDLSGSVRSETDGAACVAYFCADGQPRTAGTAPAGCRCVIGWTSLELMRERSAHDAACGSWGDVKNGRDHSRTAERGHHVPPDVPEPAGRGALGVGLQFFVQQALTPDLSRQVTMLRANSNAMGTNGSAPPRPPPGM